jgi:ParB/RepB/Spo0J family partition protein
MANSQASTVVPSASVSAVPLARIVIEEGFNPRAEIDPLEQRKLEHSIEQRGILQPVLVDPQDGGDYVLVDGHRRIEAAAKLGLMEIPISIRSSREDGDNLIDAVVANQLHAHLNPLEEALACRRLIDTRLSRKEVAAKLEMTQVTVKERLAILDLPEDLWPKVANGAIPLLAVKALVQVAGIHHDLARSAVAAVLDANVDKEEAHTWAEVAKSPLAVAVDHSESLPEGVFRSDLAYPLESFSISEKAAADLAAYTKLSGRELTVVRFDHEDVEQACLLGAAHDFDWGWLIVGQDVGDRLIEDGAAKALKQERARQRRIRQEDKARETTAGEQDAGEEQPARPESAAEREWRSEREAKAQRKGEQEERERAIQYNLDLGVLALRHLLKIKVDEQVLRILASVHVAGDLRGLASRGARLALPGWPTQTRQRNGKLKTTYLDPAEAEQRATVFLQDAEGPSDIAGRSLCSRSHRSPTRTRSRVPAGAPTDSASRVRGRGRPNETCTRSSASGSRRASSQLWTRSSTGGSPKPRRQRATTKKCRPRGYALSSSAISWTWTTRAWRGLWRTRFSYGAPTARRPTSCVTRSTPSVSAATRLTRVRRPSLPTQVQRRCSTANTGRWPAGSQRLRRPSLAQPPIREMRGASRPRIARFACIGPGRSPAPGGTRPQRSPDVYRRCPSEAGARERF